MKNNYKLILCLLVLILASISCVAASEDVNTTTDNNDFSIATDNVAIDEPDEVQTIESSNIDDKNNIQTTTNNSGGDVATIDSNSYSLNKPIKATHGISNENHAKLYTSASTYNGEAKSISGNFSNLQKTLNESSDNDNISLNCSNYTYNNTNDHEKVTEG